LLLSLSLDFFYMAAGKRRPTYPPAVLVLLEMLVVYAKGAALATAACFALEGTYRSLAARVADDRLFVTATLAAVHTALYLGLNSLFQLCTACGWLRQYKIPHKAIAEPTSALVWSTVLQQLPSLVLQPLALYYFLFDILVRQGMPAPSSPLPPAGVVFACMLAAVAANDFGFYAAHRLLHEAPGVYARVHKQHHEYKATIGFAAEYANPLEALLANLLPTVGLAAALGYHPLVFLVWLAWRLEETYESHSGYDFSDTLLARVGLLHGHKSAFHDYHHSKNMGNYGQGYLDMLFGTADSWLAEGRPALHLLPWQPAHAHAS